MQTEYNSRSSRIIVMGDKGEYLTVLYSTALGWEGEQEARNWADDIRKRPTFKAHGVLVTDNQGLELAYYHTQNRPDSLK